MSEEEKKELEHIKKRAEFVNQNIMGTNVFTTYDIHCVNTLIKIIEKQQKEIEHWKAGMKIVERDKNNHIERLEKELDNIKEIEKSHKKENGKLRVKLEKKDKMIELMARFIDTELSSEHLSKVLKIEVKPLETYREDIKQYFEKRGE